jgi:protein-tyrosine phosphatase
MLRSLLVTLLLATPLHAAPARPALAETAAPAAFAQASRDGASVTLRWVGLDGPVQIWQLPGPDARAGEGQKLVASAAGQSATIPVPAWPRPYFLLRDRNGQELRTAERLLPLDGGSNFRDLGGYAAADGATTAWGQLYRSAVMAGLTPDDFQRLGKLGIQTVCDFRSTDERQRDPVTWPQGVQPTVIATDYGLDTGAIAAMFRAGPVTAETTRKAMAGFYAEMPFIFADQYAAMLRALVDGKAPLAFNCSAGKDRTGLASALLLTLLGVPYETVVKDYLLSNETYRPKPPAAGGDDPTARMFAAMPKDALQALMGVDRSYLDASFAAIEAQGGMERYAAQQLKLAPADLETLRSRYLRPASR